MADAIPAVVPPGERDALAKTAQETGERFGRMEAKIDAHADHFVQLNGSVGKLATSHGEQATSLAVMAAAVRVLADNAQATGAGVERRQGMTLQVKLVLLAGGLAFTTAVFVACVSFVFGLLMLWANGKLG